MMSTQKGYCLSRNKIFCNFCPGFCCYKTGSASLYIMASDINRIARHLNISDGEVRKRFMDGRSTFKTRKDGSCIFLHNDRLCRRCSIHAARPKQCRDFPYDRPCPYLEDEELLTCIQAKIEYTLLPGSA